MTRKEVFSIWFILAAIPLLYGLECFVAYGSRYGYSIGWKLASPFAVWGIGVTVITLLFGLKKGKTQ